MKASKPLCVDARMFTRISLDIDPRWTAKKQADVPQEGNESRAKAPLWIFVVAMVFSPYTSLLMGSGTTTPGISWVPRWFGTEP